MRFSYLFGIAFILATAFAAKSAKDWEKLRLEEVDKQLEEGDDPELLVTEDEIKIAEMERRRTASPLEQPIEARIAGAKDHVKHTQSTSGPTMLFATLRPTSNDGASWTKEMKQIETTKWTDLLRTAGIQVGIYDVDDHKILLTLQEGWRGFEVKDFLLHQDSVASVEWDKIVYSSDDSDARSQRARNPEARSAQRQRFHKTDDLPEHPLKNTKMPKKWEELVRQSGSPVKVAGHTEPKQRKQAKDEL